MSLITFLILANLLLQKLSLTCIPLSVYPRTALSKLVFYTMVMEGGEDDPGNNLSGGRPGKVGVLPGGGGHVLHHLGHQKGVVNTLRCRVTPGTLSEVVEEIDLRR